LTSPIVPPQPRKVMVIGRPKTRAALRASAASSVFAIFLATFGPDTPEPLLVTLGAALVAGVIAGILRVFERPRQFVEYRSSLSLGLPVVHAGDAALPADSPPRGEP